MTSTIACELCSDTGTRPDLGAMRIGTGFCSCNLGNALRRLDTCKTIITDLVGIFTQLHDDCEYAAAESGGHTHTPFLDDVREIDERLRVITMHYPDLMPKR